MRLGNHDRRIPRWTLLIAAVSLVACNDGGVVAPVDSTQPLYTRGGNAAINLDGDWAWSEVTIIKLRPFVAELFGFVPEGPMTHITCEDGGELHIDQAGSSFTGDATQSGFCYTKGGQWTDTPPFPGQLPLIDGEIRGRSFRFTYDAGPFPPGGQIFCPYRGAIHVEDGEAVRLEGSGDCLLPNEHLAGHDFVLSFVATRR